MLNGGSEMTFGEWVKYLRKDDKQLTQEELAKMLGITPTYISKIENDKLAVLPSEDLIRRMAQVLGDREEHMLTTAGKINGNKLEAIARHNVLASSVLRRMQSGELDLLVWNRIFDVVFEND